MSSLNRRKLGSARGFTGLALRVSAALIAVSVFAAIFPPHQAHANQATVPANPAATAPSTASGATASPPASEVHVHAPGAR